MPRNLPAAEEAKQQTAAATIAERTKAAMPPRESDIRPANRTTASTNPKM